MNEIHEYLHLTRFNLKNNYISNEAIQRNFTINQFLTIGTIQIQNC